MKTATDWAFRNRKDSVALVISYDWILLRPMVDEVAISHPLRLQEFELPFKMCGDQHEYAAALHSIILENVFGERWAKIGGTPQNMVEIDGDPFCS